MLRKAIQQQLLPSLFLLFSSFHSPRAHERSRGWLSCLLACLRSSGDRGSLWRRVVGGDSTSVRAIGELFDSSVAAAFITPARERGARDMRHARIRYHQHQQQQQQQPSRYALRLNTTADISP